MYPWPKCISCTNPMPVLASGKGIEVHSCQQCEKILVAAGDNLTWYSGIYTLRECLIHMPSLGEKR